MYAGIGAINDLLFYSCVDFFKFSIVTIFFLLMAHHADVLEVLAEVKFIMAWAMIAFSC